MVLIQVHLAVIVLLMEKVKVKLQLLSLIIYLPQKRGVMLLALQVFMQIKKQFQASL